MEKIIPKLFLVILSVSYSIQQQNLCGSPPTSTPVTQQYVADPAHCSFYLYCHRNEADPSILIAVYQASCPLGYFFKATVPGETGICVNNHDHCADLCPAAHLPDIMIADYTDHECRRHRPCRMPGMPWATCASGLVFNRNSGTCGLPSSAPCNNQRAKKYFVKENKN